MNKQTSHSLLRLSQEEYTKFKIKLKSNGYKLSYFFTKAVSDYMSGKYDPWLENTNKK